MIESLTIADDDWTPRDECQLCGDPEPTAYLTIPTETEDGEFAVVIQEVCSVCAGRTTRQGDA